MATTAVTLNGTTYFIPQPGERGITYDQDLTNYLIALATAFPQGGTTPSSTFLALTSAGSNPATAGRIRLSFADLIDWRNSANTGNLPLGMVNGSQTNGDNLSLVDSGGNTVLITGQCYAEFNTTAAQSITTGTVTVINFGTQVTDTDGAVTTGAAWKFTVPTGKGGRYLVCALVNMGGLTADTGTLQCAVTKNGATVQAGDTIYVGKNGSQVSLGAIVVINAAAADTLAFTVNQNQGASRTLTANAVDNRITIQRLV